MHTFQGQVTSTGNTAEPYSCWQFCQRNGARSYFWLPALTSLTQKPCTWDTPNCQNRHKAVLSINYSWLKMTARLQMNEDASGSAQGIAQNYQEVIFKHRKPVHSRCLPSLSIKTSPKLVRLGLCHLDVMFVCSLWWSALKNLEEFWQGKRLQ